MQNVIPEIKIQDLKMYYDYNNGKSKPVLKSINVNIPKNKLTTIIGPSGCGKTTLLKSINRLHDIKNGTKVEGHIIIADEDIFHSKYPVVELRKKVGLVTQKPYPLPDSIYKNVTYGPNLHRKLTKEQSDRIVEKYLKKVNLWAEVKDRLHSPAADLSLGQQQRLCIARSLSIEPEVILCDEITSSLDPISSEKIENLLLELKDNYTIVVVTHIMRQARRLADFVIFMYLGELIEKGPAEQVFGSPNAELTRQYLSSGF